MENVSKIPKIPDGYARRNFEAWPAPKVRRSRRSGSLVGADLPPGPGPLKVRSRYRRGGVTREYARTHIPTDVRNAQTPQTFHRLIQANTEHIQEIPKIRTGTQGGSSPASGPPKIAKVRRFPFVRTGEKIVARLRPGLTFLTDHPIRLVEGHLVHDIMIVTKPTCLRFKSPPPVWRVWGVTPLNFPPSRRGAFV